MADLWRQTDSFARIGAVPAAAGKVTAGPRAIGVDRAGIKVAAIRRRLNRQISAPLAVADDHQTAVLGNDEVGMGFHERIARSDFDGMVRLAAARAALLTIEVGRPGWAGGPGRVDAFAAVASTAIHSFSTSARVPPDTGAAILCGTGGAGQRIRERG